MSTDLDTNIRSFLARLEDATPMAPPLSMLRIAEPTVHHGRALSITVSAAVAVAGVAGIAAVRMHGGGGPVASTDLTAVAPAVADAADPSDSSAPTTGAAVTSVPVTDDPAGDPAMSASFYSLLEVQTPAELTTFLSGNVPESDVADCMHAGGYAYVEESSPQEQVADDPRMTMSAIDYATAYGFGSASEALGLVPHRPLAEESPNLAHVQSLSPAEQTTWFAAQHWCRGGDDGDRVRQSGAWSTAIASFRDLLRSDAQVVDALATWRTCMAAAGHPFTDPQTMRDELSQRALQAGLTVAQLQQLFADEVSVAVANVPCEAPYTSTYRTVATQRFVEFRALFDAAAVAPAG